MPTAFKVALFIGSLLFTINHGWALLTGHMTSERWISGGLTYIVPYMVSIHGQYIGRKGRVAKNLN
ncbi:nitrate/nitrite transporter NrtS [Nostocaceae cyanobacterium CENA369]|uniref:Nitrate/nitrite transporter NrtS n=2 Tax=Dendronalium TaxID=2840442 RepID=A0A8J7I5J1_9NOST|nr:nitrate/nitrite transporter NrtS [Dendronalium phyllosphericum CENA369]